MLNIGEKLPQFKLQNQDGDLVTEKSLIGHYSVLYFYPKDDTPGCTKEACGFTESISGFKKLSIPVYGVSPDTVESHKRFVDKYDLKIELLADPDKEFCNQMGIIGERNLYGKIVVGVLRTTFLIDPEGKVVEVFKNVKVDGHIEKVYNKLQEIIQG